MRITEILRRIDIARSNLKEIMPEIKAYIVIVFGTSQYQLQDIDVTNVELFLNCTIFVPDKNNAILFANAKECKVKKKANEILKKEGKFDNESCATLKNNEIRIEEIKKQLTKALQEVEFLEPRCELRFEAFTIEAIQKIKQHPIVQQIGKTEISAASIRIVIG